MLVSEAVRATRQYLGNTRDTLNRLSADAGIGATTVSLEFSTNLPRAGHVLELRDDDNAELVHVWSITGSDATVEREFDDSLGEYAFVTGDHVAVNPALSYTDVLKEIINEIRSLPSEGLYKLGSSSVTYDYTLDGYDTSALTGVVSPLAIQYVIGGREIWVYDLIENPGLVRAPKLTIPDAGSATLHYRGDFTAPTALSDDLATDCGLPDSAQDVVALGAAVRLAYTREQLRSQVAAQPHARASEDVPSGSGARSVALLENWRKTRLNQEVRRLHEDYPRRRI